MIEWHNIFVQPCLSYSLPVIYFNLVYSALYIVFMLIHVFCCCLFVCLFKIYMHFFFHLQKQTILSQIYSQPNFLPVSVIFIPAAFLNERMLLSWNLGSCIFLGLKKETLSLWGEGRTAVPWGGNQNNHTKQLFSQMLWIHLSISYLVNLCILINQVVMKAPFWSYCWDYN